MVLAGLQCELTKGGENHPLGRAAGRQEGPASSGGVSARKTYEHVQAEVAKNHIPLN